MCLNAKKMLGVVLTVVASIVYIEATAQFAIVSDPDGYANLRSNADKHAAIIDTLGNGRLVFCLERTANWMNIDYLKSLERTGYVYHDRLEMIGSYRRIAVMRPGDHGTARDSISVSVADRPFVAKNHKLRFDADRVLLKIDGRDYWGQDGGVPVREYAELRVYFGKTLVSLPAAALQGLYEPNLEQTEAFYDAAHRILYIQSLNSDGAGGYFVVWRIVDGRYTDRLVTTGF